MQYHFRFRVCRAATFGVRLRAVWQFGKTFDVARPPPSLGIGQNSGRRGARSIQAIFEVSTLLLALGIRTSAGIRRQLSERVPP